MNNWRLTNKQIDEFTELLCACMCIENSDSREQIIIALGEKISRRIVRSNILNSAAHSIVRVCNSYYGGIDALLKTIEEYEQGTFQWHEIQEWVARQNTVGINMCIDLKIPFENRVAEKNAILSLLEETPRIQIQALRGWGKTYMLEELQSLMKAQGWETVWIDLQQDSNRELRFDRTAFLREFARQCLTLDILDSCDADDADDKNVLGLIGRRLANSENIALFIDNADNCDRIIASWFGRRFLPTIDEWVPQTRVITAGQQIVPEWKGAMMSRPFKVFPLQLINDTSAIKKIVDNVVENYGARRAKDQRLKDGWGQKLSTMSDDIVNITKGHLLLIERVLKFAARVDGFVHADYFTKGRESILKRCVLPAVNERLLRDLDRYQSQSFRQLCVFRYITFGILARLIEERYPEIQEDETTHIFSDLLSGQTGWGTFLGVGLIGDVQARSIFPVSSVIRQVIVSILRTENEMLYQERNRRAQREFELLLENSTFDSQLYDDKLREARQRCAYVLEICYHLAQDTSYNQSELSVLVTDKVNSLLKTLRDSSVLPLVASMLISWLRSDDELNDVITRRTDSSIYENLIQLVENSTCVNGGELS